MPSPHTPGDDAANAALRRQAARSAAASALLLAALAAAAVFATELGGWLAAKALAVFACGVALVWHGLPGHRPHTRFGAANALTLLRFALIALLAATLGDASGDPERHAWALVALAAIAASLDAIDGPLARAQGTASAFGARFDMEVDAFLVLVLSALVWQLDKAGAWILAAGLMRYAFVSASLNWPWLAAPLAPNWRRKAICVVQIVSLIVCLAPVVGGLASRVIAAASLVALLASFAIDTVWLARGRHRAKERFA